MKFNKISYLINFIKIKKAVVNKTHFFFFPFYHIGGAERVHLDILSVFDKKKTICFITNQSMNDYFFNEFKSKTTVIEIGKFIPKHKQKLVNLIVNVINRTNNGFVFGCNSHLFYDIIPQFKTNIKIVDLIHAFSYEEPYAAEKYSLPFVERINNRIILGKKTYLDFEKLYINNNIDSKNLKKIKIIKNKVDVPTNFPIKSNTKNLKILFVGRNSSEKRPEIFFKIAQRCIDLNMHVKFNVIGDFDKTMIVAKNITISGIINEKKILNQQYKNSDILLITSSREGFPMVILESMAYGVIPIATNVGEISEFVNDSNKNGFLINNNTNENIIVNDFIVKIQSLIDNRTLVDEMQLKAYLTISNNYTSKLFESNYLEILKKR